MQLANVVAFFSPIFLFIFWWFLGYSILAVLYTQRNLVQNMLLAPVIGMAFTLLLIFCFSCFGFPVEQFAWLMTIFLLSLSAGLWWKCRPIVPWQRYLAFAGILFVALWLTGRPLLEYGFAWLSYTNDDMANYCLGAIWFLHHGYNANINVNELIQGHDYSLYYWLMFVPGMTRCGSELLLAWMSKITDLTPDRIFMIVILAMHLVLISATGALVYQSRRWRLATLTVCGLLSISAMVSLGALYQLIAQVGGIGLLSGNFVILLRPFYHLSYKYILRFSLLIALLVSALLIDYPEVFPFLVLSFFAYHGLMFVIKRIKPAPSFLIASGIAAIVSLVILNKNILNVFTTLLGQVDQGFSIVDVKQSLFPYFLVPSGLADLLGLHAIAWYVPEPFLSISIFLSGLLLIFVFISALFLAYQCYAIAIVFLIMFGVGIKLFLNNNDFGLFKLAMYIQPYMLAILAVSWLSIVKKPLWRWLPFLFFGLITLVFQYAYLERSRNYRTTDIPGASQTQINAEFEQLLNSHKKTTHWVSDTPNIVLGKFQALYLKDKEATFLSRHFFINLRGLYRRKTTIEQLQRFKPALLQQAESICEVLDQTFQDLPFNLHDKVNPKKVNIFNFVPLKITNDVMLVMSTPKQTILNRREFIKNEMRNYVALPWRDVHNHLVFIRSKLGQHYYLPQDFSAKKNEFNVRISNDISYQMFEKDYFYPEQKFVGIGRHLLFEVINPSPKVRLMLNITNSLNADGKNQLPPAAIIGNQRKSLPIIGRGSARIFSPPFKPQFINHTPYIALDMGVDGKVFPSQHSGLMKLYGTNVAMDRRQLVGFVRDISLVSEQQYQQLKSPRFIKDLPSDLANPDLEYSGMYEDGWVAESSFFNLNQKKSTSVLLIKGHLPLTVQEKKHQTLSVFIDGKLVRQEKVVPDYFVIKIPVSLVSSRRHIELHFSETHLISSGDIRPAAALLNFIGFVSDSEAAELIKEQPKKELLNEKYHSIVLQKINGFYARIKAYKNLVL